ncbi:MAG: site-specific integrase [Ruminococcaceae bacterium]|nr:site-specific integrase [Oscillospiraceae bacterium]
MASENEMVSKLVSKKESMMGNTRRKNGEGSIFQLSDDKWIAKISLGTGANGKPVVKQFSGKTEAIVKKKLRDFKKSYNYLAGHMPAQETVQIYFVRWLKDYQYNKLKPASYDRLETTVRCHIIPTIGAKKIDKVTRDDVQGLINTLYYQDGLSYSTVKKVYVALNACYKHALTDDTVLRNPCQGIILPSQSERTKQITAFSDDEVQRLQTELMKKDDRGNNAYYYSPVFILMLHTGMRMGETLALKWDDVDFTTRTITVTKNSIMIKNRDNTGQCTGGYKAKVQNSTKTASGTRVIPLNKKAEEALYALQKRKTSQYVVENSKGNAVLPSNLERSFQVVLRNCGLGKHGAHILRHTFASMLFAKGVEGKMISKLLGHSSVKITYDIYVHVMPKEIVHVTDVLL